MTAIGNVSLLLAKGSQASIDERVAVFSDALNHASIIDGIRLAEKQKSVAAFVYRHCDVHHLNELLYVIFIWFLVMVDVILFFICIYLSFNRTNCPMKKRVVITDRLVMIESFTCYQLHLHCHHLKNPEAQG